MTEETPDLAERVDRLEQGLREAAHLLGAHGVVSRHAFGQTHVLREFVNERADQLRADEAKLVAAQHAENEAAQARRRGEAESAKARETSIAQAAYNAARASGS